MSAEVSAAELQKEVEFLRSQVSTLQAKCQQLEATAKLADGGNFGVPQSSSSTAEAREPCSWPRSRPGVESRDFQETASALLDPHMGVENMGPLLYSLVRFVKPMTVLEVGSGYTSIWILQALADNTEELRVLRGQDCATPVAGVPWYIDTAVQDTTIPTLHCVDNLEHSHTTAHRVTECAEALGISTHLRVHVANAFEIFEGSTAVGQLLSGLKWDLLWFDGISACTEWPCFFRDAWQRLKDRGLALVHSSLTNTTTRNWLSSVLEEASKKGPWISFEVTPAESTKGCLAELAGQVGEVLRPHTWRHRLDKGKLLFQMGLEVGADAFEVGLAVADDVAAVEGVAQVSNILPTTSGLAGMHHVGFLEPHKRMQNSVSILQKRSATNEFSEPTFSYLP